MRNILYLFIFFSFSFVCFASGFDKDNVKVYSITATENFGGTFTAEQVLSVFPSGF